MFCPYHWPDDMKEFSGNSTYEGWKYGNRVIHNTDHGGHIENSHHSIYLMKEDIANRYEISKSNTPDQFILKEFLDNNNTTRDKMYLIELGATKDQSIRVSMMLQTGIEVVKDSIVFNFLPQDHRNTLIPKKEKRLKVKGVRQYQHLCSEVTIFSDMLIFYNV